MLDFSNNLSKNLLSILLKKAPPSEKMYQSRGVNFHGRGEAETFSERGVFPVLIRARSTPIIDASGGSGPSGGSLVGGNNILPWPSK